MPSRILVVDDEENYRRTLAIGLRIECFDISEARDGAEALERLKEQHFDLAIIDLMMPGINGLELARRMRFRYPDVQIVLTSAYHLTQRQLERANIGEVLFVPKPYRLDELVASIRAQLEPAIRAAV